MITTPPIFTPIHQEEITYQDSVNEETLRKIAQNFNFLGVLVPIGTIIYVEINKVGVVAPDESIWQLCDGSEITNSNSPLRSQGIISRFVPDLLGKHPRGAVLSNSNPQGGTYSYSFDHNHSTGNNSPAAPNTLDEEGGRRVGNTHTHGIKNDLAGLTFDFPAAIKYVPYMKIT